MGMKGTAMAKMAKNANQHDGNIVSIDFGGGAKKGTTVDKNANLTDRIFDEIEKEPRTVGQLAAACDCTEKQVRNAVTALRRRYRADNAKHVVSYKAQFWTAAELERRGFALRPTKNGLKVCSAPKQSSPKQAKKKTAKNRNDVIAKVLAELGDSPDAMRVAGIVVKRYDVFQKAENALAGQRQKARDQIKAAEAFFTESIEEGLEVGDQNAAVQKLHHVEESWQMLKEKRSGAVEIRKKALEKRNKARDAFAGVVENLRQLEFEFDWTG
jgi:hypothetical protein